MGQLVRVTDGVAFVSTTALNPLIDRLNNQAKWLCRAYWDGTPATNVNNGDIVPINTVNGIGGGRDYDPAGLFDPVHHWITVPVGGRGFWAVGCKISLGAVQQALKAAVVITKLDASTYHAEHGSEVYPAANATYFPQSVAVGIAHLEEGEHISAGVGYVSNGPQALSQGNVTGTSLWAHYIGPHPLD